MARGKYAARAANARAGEAQERIAELEGRLAQEKAAHASDVTSLNARIEQLQGKLIRDVGAIANAAIEAAKNEAQARVEAVEAEAKARSLAVFKVIDANTQLLPEQWLALYTALGVHPTDDPGGGYEDMPRYARRAARATNITGFVAE